MASSPGGRTVEALNSEFRSLGYLVSDGRQKVRLGPVRGRAGLREDPSLYSFKAHRGAEGSPDAFKLDPVSYMHHEVVFLINPVLLF